MIGTEPMRTPDTTNTTEPASGESVRRRTTDVIVSESTTNADAT